MKQFKFSLITPEHDKNNIYLLELYESIIEQTYTNWEWIIYLNNGCLPEHIPNEIREDSRVSIILGVNNTNIGALKKSSFDLGTGDILVEMDHDDMLTPDCLEELNKAYQDESVGFVYSDNAVLHMTGEFIPYPVEDGWKQNPDYEWKGKSLKSMNTWPVSSKTIGFIWYAPDHIRTWRTTTYKELTGHNPDMWVCEDQELMIRTYLHSKMVKIDKVLYIYRITGENTSLTKRNAAIQVKCIELFKQYAQKLAEREADLKGLMKIDIGGGLNPYPGYFSVDLRDTADMINDLNDGISLPDNSVFVLNASHIIEHLYDKTKIMSEIHRVLAHGGWAFIEVPSTDGRGAFQDPTHVSYWNENSFMYYLQANLAAFIDNKTIRFQQFRRETHFPNDWMKSINSCVTTAWLVAIKDDSERYPGKLTI